MEVAVEVEDDLSFADLSRQIALLIMDEDEDPATLSRCSEASLDLQAFSRAAHPPSQSYVLYEQANYRRESKGTGVFIPQSTPRRKTRQGRSYEYNKKSQRQSEDTRMTMSRVSHDYSLEPSNVEARSSILLHLAAKSTYTD